MCLRPPYPLRRDDHVFTTPLPPGNQKMSKKVKKTRFFNFTQKRHVCIGLPIHVKKHVFFTFFHFFSKNCVPPRSARCGNTHHTSRCPALCAARGAHMRGTLFVYCHYFLPKNNLILVFKCNDFFHLFYLFFLLHCMKKKLRNHLSNVGGRGRPRWEAPNTKKMTFFHFFSIPQKN